MLSIEEKLSGIPQEALIEIFASPIRWAETLLVVPDTGELLETNYVQRLILGSEKRFIAIRVHRRAGKSYALCILALYHSLTLESREILVVCPTQQQVAEIFSKIRDFIRTNEWIGPYITSDGRNPQRIEFANGSRIQGFTTGAKQKSKAVSIRGQGADVFLIDEAAYLNEEDWEALKPIMRGDRHRTEPPKVYVASTPSMAKGVYYDYCIKSEYAKYWDRIHVPVTENPDWPQEEIEDIRATSNDWEFTREWMAEFSEFGEGVFPKSMVDAARKSFTYDEYAKLAAAQRSNTNTIPTRTMGVDWDKYNRDGRGCNIVLMEATNAGNYRVIYRQEIPQSQFTLGNAVQRVIDLNDLFEPEWIFVDRGNGEFQLEELWKHGRQFKHSKLDTKVVGYTFADIVEMPTPNGTVQRKRFKDAAINLMRKWLEEGRLELSYPDTLLADEFYNYQVIGQTEHTVRYSKDNDHGIAAISLASIAMLLKVKNPYRPTQRLRAYTMPAPVAVPSDVIRREMGIGRSRISANDLVDRGGSFSRKRLGSYVPSNRSMF